MEKDNEFENQKNEKNRELDIANRDKNRGKSRSRTPNYARNRDPRRSRSRSRGYNRSHCHRDWDGGKYRYQGYRRSKSRSSSRDRGDRFHYERRYDRNRVGDARDSRFRSYNRDNRYPARAKSFQPMQQHFQITPRNIR